MTMIKINKWDFFFFVHGSLCECVRWVCCENVFTDECNWTWVHCALVWFAGTDCAVANKLMTRSFKDLKIKECLSYTIYIDHHRLECTSTNLRSILRRLPTLHLQIYINLMNFLETHVQCTHKDYAAWAHYHKRIDWKNPTELILSGTISVFPVHRNASANPVLVLFSDSSVGSVCRYAQTQNCLCEQCTNTILYTFITNKNYN